MTKSFRTLDDVDVKGKRVLLRVDLNVPTENGRVTDGTRLERVAPTITEISDKGGKAILLAHFGRPKGRDAKDSLRPVAAELSRILGKPVGFADDCIGEAAEKAVAAMRDGDILCLENTRFHPGEEKNDKAFIARLASRRREERHREQAGEFRPRLLDQFVIDDAAGAGRLASPAIEAEVEMLPHRCARLDRPIRQRPHELNPPPRRIGFQPRLDIRRARRQTSTSPRRSPAARAAR